MKMQKPNSVLVLPPQYVILHYKQKVKLTKSPASFKMWFLQEYLEVFIVFDTHCAELATILRPNIHEEKTQKRI